MMKEIKDKLFKACEAYVQERISRISLAMSDLESDLENETKSSAGDKYETGREMINLEWNKLSTQLQQFKKLKETLEMAKSNKTAEEIKLGSLVKTENANYLIAIPAGVITLGSETWFAVGANAPIAQALLNKKKGEDFSFNGTKDKIISVD
ncbi:transcription elongation factor [Salegentibacter chungangensis]|uniref:Transcription elongation factor n=1 Tax=Salegentibacter chungangensis TaxID=1335724 RepID=A0ABW3NNB7_9FLAO